MQAGIIISKPDLGSMRTIQVTSVLFQFDILFYAYIAIILYISMVCFIFIAYVSRVKCDHSLVGVAANCIKFIWSLFEMIMCQDLLKLLNAWFSQMIIWSAICFAFLINIRALVYNLMSTDLIAITQPSRISSIADLVNPHFYQFPCTIYEESNIYNLISNAKSGSNMQLYQKIRATSKTTSSTAGSGRTLFRIFMSVFAGKLAFIADRSYWHAVAHPFLCSWKPEDTIGSVKSAEFGDIIKAVMFSRRLDNHLKDYLTYKQEVVLEAGLEVKLARELGIALINKVLTLRYNWHTIKCVHGLTDDEDKADNYLSISSLKTTLVAASYGIASAVLLLVVECITSKVLRVDKIVKRIGIWLTTRFSKLLIGCRSTSKRKLFKPVKQRFRKTHIDEKTHSKTEQKLSYNSWYL